MVFLSQCFKEKDRITNFTSESYLMENEFVLIIDFGSQFTQLIARRLRELGVFSEIIPFQKVTEQSLEEYNFSHIHNLMKELSFELGYQFTDTLPNLKGLKKSEIGRRILVL